MIHAGQLIERTLHEQGRTVTWFATQLCCTRPNVYKIFRKENIDIHLLWRISCILGHDFSAIFPTASIPETSPVYPNRIQFRIVLGTMLSPGSILLSHTFAGILTYNHKGHENEKLFLIIALVVGCAVGAQCAKDGLQVS